MSYSDDECKEDGAFTPQQIARMRCFLLSDDAEEGINSWLLRDGISFFSIPGRAWGGGLSSSDREGCWVFFFGSICPVPLPLHINRTQFFHVPPRSRK
jgi:hypothetical protein